MRVGIVPYANAFGLPMIEMTVNEYMKSLDDMARNASNHQIAPFYLFHARIQNEMKNHFLMSMVDQKAFTFKKDSIFFSAMLSVKSDTAQVKNLNVQQIELF